LVPEEAGSGLLVKSLEDFLLGAETTDRLAAT
jgi:hypothetical protein